jgi:hypothetical protein
MKRHIRQLEERLSNANLSPGQELVPTADPNIKTTESSIGGTFYLQFDKREPNPITLGVTHKARLFGKSHWMNVFVLVSRLRIIGFHDESGLTASVPGIM